MQSNFYVLIHQSNGIDFVKRLLDMRNDKAIVQAVTSSSYFFPDIVSDFCSLILINGQLL